MTVAPDTVPAEALPLAGLKVVEFSHMVMGPTCGVILADLGAQVLKIEPAPDGDKTRRLPGSGAGFFPMFNRNKRSLAVDLKHPDGRDAVLRLCDGADIVFDNFGPGTMARLGFGYPVLSARNPRLIQCSLKGFLTGPYERRTALDEVVQMMAGLAYMTGPPGRPLRAGASVIDIVGGMFGVIAILAAVEQRHLSGRGQEVKASLFEACAFLVGQHMAQHAVTGVDVPPMPERLSAWGIYDVFDAADGEQVFVGVVTDAQWSRFCQVFDRPDWADVEVWTTNTGRVEDRGRLIPAVRRLFAGHAAGEIAARCEAAGLPFAPVNRPDALFDDPHLNAGGLVDVPLPDGRMTKLPGLAIELDGKRLGRRNDPPAPGTGARDWLRAVGLAEDEIDALQAKGVIVAGE